MRRSNIARTTALALVLAIVIGFLPSPVRGDEGMLLPDTISNLPIRELNRRGLKIPLTEIYNTAGVSIKDAVVIVGGGTGEFVSPEGLLLTNHHVAFEALVNASDANNNYGTKGFTARTRTDEMPAKNYTVTITQDLRDVTTEVLAGVPAPTFADERNAAIGKRIDAMEAAGSRPADGIQVHVMPMLEGLSYYQFTYLILNDVRIVYAPPKSIGFFGGDPDNFEWPRHCGDFTFMRAYVGPDGKPAEYAQNNVPFKPKKFLSLSMDGVNEGDFMMVLGYPGSTRRYRESYSVTYNQEIALPFQVDIFTRQIEMLQRVGRANPALRVKLQSTVFDLANTLKNFEGSILALRRADLVDKKRSDEAQFTRWLNETPTRKARYGDVLPSLEKAYQKLTATALRDLLIPQIFSATDLLGIAFLAQRVATEKEKPEADRSPTLGAGTVERVLGQLQPIIAERNLTVEREMLEYLLLKAAELPASQKIAAIEKRFGHLKDDARRRAEEDFARSIVDNKRFSTVPGVSQLFGLSTSQLQDLNEPVLEFAAELGAEVQNISRDTDVFNTAVSRWRPFLLEGMSEMRGVKPYPDANRTLRFSYGEVRGYVPREAITYTAFTTLAGVVEKDSGREPFDVPEKLKQLFRTKDFGRYAGPNNSAVPVDFLSTTDIIGGNSGSPILNGRGEQVGIIFDGNYEGLGNDFFYNGATGRAIAVDIRYVLFITEKFGDAGHVLKELNISTFSGKARKTE